MEPAERLIFASFHLLNPAHDPAGGQIRSVQIVAKWRSQPAFAGKSETAHPVIVFFATALRNVLFSEQASNTFATETNAGSCPVAKTRFQQLFLTVLLLIECTREKPANKLSTLAERAKHLRQSLRIKTEVFPVLHAGADSGLGGHSSEGIWRGTDRLGRDRSVGEADCSTRRDCRDRPSASEATPNNF
jgi:hypothetical protein